MPSTEKTFWADANGRCEIMPSLKFVIVIGNSKDFMCLSGGTSLY